GGAAQPPRVVAVGAARCDDGGDGGGAMADGRRFGDGMAAGPDLQGAAEVAVGQALAPLDGARPDLLCVFVAPGAGHDPERAAAAGRRAMELGAARTAIGATASGVIGDGHGREHGPAVAAWAAVLPGARITPYRLEVTRAGENLHVGGLPQPADDDRVAAML